MKIEDNTKLTIQVILAVVLVLAGIVLLFCGFIVAPPNHDIARQFGIAHVSVKKQLKTIFAKLGAANRAEAVAIAISKQLVMT